MSAPSSTTRIRVFLMSPPQHCHDCGGPASWFAVGVSGCARRCGALTYAEWEDAGLAVLDYVKRDEARLRQLGLGVVVDAVLRTFDTPGAPPASSVPRQLAAASR